MRFVFIFNLFIIATVCKAQLTAIPLKTTDDKTEYISLQQKATVILFLSPECPLCQSYTLTIKNLDKEFAKYNIEFLGIVPGTDFNLQSIKDYINDYAITIKILRDEKNELVKQLNATITPETFVVNPSGKVLYSGRIDNWAYELGKKRKVITEHNLKDALNAIINNQPIKVTKTKAVGCYIE